MPSTHDQDMSALERELELKFQEDFKDECQQKLETISTYLEETAETGTSPEGAFTHTMREVHSMKGMGSTFGFPAITVVAHRMEDFLTSKGAIRAEDVQEIYVFVDALGEAVEIGNEFTQEKISEITRTLPLAYERAPLATDVEAQQPKDIEVLSIMPKGVQQRLINQELAACGFRVSHIYASFKAIEIAVNTQPDLIVISALVDTISGLELARVLRAINTTKNTPIILMTSFDENDLPQSDVPPLTAIARKGERFAEDLSDCLITLGIVTR